MAYIKQFLAAFFLLAGFQMGTAQVELDEQVPYQGDTLLTNPNQFRVTSAGDVLMDCDWPAMMAMIRDLEERIAGETETDTTYGVTSPVTSMETTSICGTIALFCVTPLRRCK